MGRVLSGLLSRATRHLPMTMNRSWQKLVQNTRRHKHTNCALQGSLKQQRGLDRSLERRRRNRQILDTKNALPQESRNTRPGARHLTRPLHRSTIQQRPLLLTVVLYQCAVAFPSSTVSKSRLFPPPSGEAEAHKARETKTILNTQTIEDILKMNMARGIVFRSIWFLVTD